MVVPPRPPQEVLALIPARGGSKSIPRKNLRLLAGKPLIAHSIEQAAASQLITRVIVSTDDAEIAELAKQAGADVPFLRPSELAQDYSRDLEVFQHALTWLAQHEGYRPDVVVQLRPSAPLRRVETIDAAIRAFLARPDVDSLRSVSVAQQTPYKMWTINTQGCLEPAIAGAKGHEVWNMPRQGLPRVYWQNGYIDMTRPEVILQRHTMTGQRILSFVIHEPCVEIDYEDHLALAERLLAGQAVGELAGDVERHPS